MDMVAMLLQILQVAILVRIVYSWIDPNPYPTNAFKRIVWAITDPVLVPLRRVIPPIGMMDFSPLIAIVLIGVVQRALFSSGSGALF
jgi:YggT family protein